MVPNQPTSDVPDGSSGGILSRFTGHRRSQSQSQSQSQPRPNATQAQSPNRRRDRAPPYSDYSTQGPFPSRMFFSENFMLGAGAVIIQPSSGKVVIVQDGDSWFLPKGRKDLGESVEQAALREAYEEVRLSLSLNLSPIAFSTHGRQSGYRCEFLPLYHWTNAPVGSRLAYGQKHTEPLYVTITSYAGRRNRPPGEYLTFWYTCQIGPDAVSESLSRSYRPRISQTVSGQVRELGTGMPDEAGYIGHLVTVEVADQLLGDGERWVLAAARNEWVRSLEIDERIRATEAQKGGEERQSNLNNDGEST